MARADDTSPPPDPTPTNAAFEHLVERLRALEREIEQERQARLELEARVSDQRAQIADLARATQSILTSRIWRTLASVGSRLLAVQAAIGQHILRRAPRLRRKAPKATSGPLISVLMPVYETPEKWLRAVIESVLHQSYRRWELCITDDCSGNPAVRQILTGYAAREAKIRLEFRGERGGIAIASNSCLAMAKGSFVAMLDHDDELTPDALAEVAAAIEHYPSASIIYSDEDKIDEHGLRFDPFFKPDWSPEYLLGCMYLGHLTVYCTDVVRQLGGFRPEMEGAQDYDLALRAAVMNSAIVHIPKILYHWRTLETSTSSGLGAKDYAYRAAKLALSTHLEKTGFTGTVLPAAGRGAWRVRFNVKGEPSVGAVIVGNGNGRHILPTLEWPKLRVATAATASAAVNRAALEIPVDYLVILNPDTEPVSADLIERLLEYCQLPGVGVVGPRILSANGRIQSAGLLFIGGRTRDAYAGCDAQDPGYFFSAQLARNYLAVSGVCFATPAAAFLDSGGLDSALPLETAVVDYCLRLRVRGLRTVYTPFADVIHHKTATAPDKMAGEELLSRWADLVSNDPFYNPNLPRVFAYYPPPPG